MDTDYFYHTPYVGRLMDPGNFAPERPEKTRPAYTDNPIGESPSVAREHGARVSGRIINAMTTLTHVVVCDRDTGVFGLRPRRGLTSLYGAVSDLQNKTDWAVTNVGWSGEIEYKGSHKVDPPVPTSEDKVQLRREFTELSHAQTEPVWLDGPAAQWREYAEHVMWPTSHYMQSMDFEDNDEQATGWAHYVQFNQAYCDLIVKLFKPGDIVWVHDYYLYLLPHMLREKLPPDAYIGCYIHTPFPSSEFIRCIPQRAELLEGILGSTLVGFQSDSYVRHFVSSCIRVLGNDHEGDDIVSNGRVVSCQALPIGIDTDEVIKKTESKAVRELVGEIRSLYKGKKIIIGRDKFDGLNSVLQKLRAFGLFLQAYPEWREKVVLVQITTPAYDHTPKLEKKVAELVAEINGTYGTMQSWPIQHYSRHIAQEEYFALLEVADLGLFTGVRDSTSHAVLEYITCQRQTHHPVIVSEFMGLANFFREALIVNPYDGMSIAQAINVGLVEGDYLVDTNWFGLVSKFTVHTWVRTFLGNLIQHDFQHESKHYTPELDISQIAKSYKAAQRRLFLFDYDGTLTPIVKDPAAALPSDRMKSLFTKLCEDPQNEVWIISGRDQKFLDQQLAPFGLNMSAEHGSFVKRKGEDKWTDLVAKMDNSWQKIVLEVLQSYTQRTQGAVIEQKKASITWHYRRADPVFGAFQASHLRAYLEVTVANKYPVDVMSGKANVEVRPKMFNKGEIVRSIFEDAQESPDFALCMGDDTTDEDMFKAVGEQHKPDKYYTVVIGPADKLTIAQKHLSNPHKVHDAIEAMLS